MTMKKTKEQIVKEFAEMFNDLSEEEQLHLLFKYVFIACIAGEIMKVVNSLSKEDRKRLARGKKWKE